MLPSDAFRVTQSGAIGDGSARGVYGREVLAMDDCTCAYRGLEMLESFDLDRDLIEDGASLVTCCRACSEFGNR